MKMDSQTKIYREWNLGYLLEMLGKPVKAMSICSYAHYQHSTEFHRLYVGQGKIKHKDDVFLFQKPLEKQYRKKQFIDDMLEHCLTSLLLSSERIKTCSPSFPAFEGVTP